jgi:hypothetical protein
VQHRSPTLEGFRLAVTRPALGLAEIAWRWSFGAALIALLALSVREYLRSIAVGSSDLLLLGTRQPALISKALQHIFNGTSLRVIEAVCVLFIALTVAWIVTSSLGRAATLKEIVAHFRTGKLSLVFRTRSLFGIQFLRATVSLAALIGSFAAVLLAGRVISEKDPSPGAAFLIFISVFSLAWFLWAILNWLLALSSIFVVARDLDTFSAIGEAVALCGSRLGPLLAVGSWYGLAHAVAISIAGSAIAFPLAFAAIMPFGVVFGGAVLVALIYFAVVDYLYIARLAAYVAILELSVEVSQPIRSASLVNRYDRIDPDELILSDVPV